MSLTSKAYLPENFEQQKSILAALMREGHAASTLLQTLHLNYALREQYVSKFGFVLLTTEVVDVLAHQLQGLTVLDAGSGSGYISKILSDRGIAITACDEINYNLPQERHGYGFNSSYKLDVIDHPKNLLAEQDFDVVLLAWPCYSTNFGTEVLLAMKPGQLLIYQGEGSGGCTGNDAMHDLLSDTSRFSLQVDLSQALNLHHQQWSGIHDYWRVYRVI